MTYKLKSLIYLLSFLASIFIYNSMDQSIKTDFQNEEIQVVQSNTDELNKQDNHSLYSTLEY
jgi:type II secretory pathway component PulC